MNKDLNYYMALPYRVEVIPDEEEGGFALHCPELNGCMTCAETLEEGVQNAGGRQAVLVHRLHRGRHPHPRTHTAGGLQWTV